MDKNEGSFKNFEEYNKALQSRLNEEADKAKTIPAKEKLLNMRELREKFENVIGNNFQLIPEDKYPSEMPNTLFVDTHLEKSKTGETSWINLNLNCQTSDNKLKNFNASVFPDGRISIDPKIVPALEKLDIKIQDILSEFIRSYERISLGKIYFIDDDILPPGKGGERGPRIEGGEERQRLIEDRRRLEFLESQPDLLLTFCNINRGFTGYRGHVFSKFTILENSMQGNAAYIIKHENPIHIDPSRILSHEGENVKRQIADEAYGPYSQFDKQEMLHLAGDPDSRVERFIHRGNWEEAMQSKLDELRGEE